MSLSIYPSEKVKLKTQNKLVCFSGYVVEMDYYIYFIGLGFGMYNDVNPTLISHFNPLCFNGGNLTVFLGYRGFED